ncbi:hypothetical protein Ade02nite_81780 [Paractinoplanes deccanensis]|uniref:DUF4259 domain-containing protein n=1 Tax=Paractinoplanes deccanensis TaxID=113561 RepID=A0ABQ3YHT8_9ACTN|nr:DUF4259 domain-containing protein [Actinoplanes deccanensis]GID79537.1 hypothetical protein Ade02nite_81780 [Actinoplanes deccanensis]
MGTWASGPFENDQALDLLTELSELDDDEKEQHLRGLFADALEASPSERVWPKEVIAGAALVALALPGGAAVIGDEGNDYDPDEDDDEELSSALLRRPSGELAGLALRAMNEIIRPDGEWYSSWIREDERDVALGRAAVAARLLRSSSAS